MPAKFERCVKKVKKQNRNVNPYAICHSSMNKKMMKDKNINTNKKIYCIDCLGRGRITGINSNNKKSYFECSKCKGLGYTIKENFQ